MQDDRNTYRTENGNEPRPDSGNTEGTPRSDVDRAAGADGGNAPRPGATMPANADTGTEYGTGAGYGPFSGGRPQGDMGESGYHPGPGYDPSSGGRAQGDMGNMGESGYYPGTGYDPSSGARPQGDMGNIGSEAGTAGDPYTSSEPRPGSGPTYGYSRTFSLPHPTAGKAVNIAGFRIKPIYLYIFAGIVLLIAMMLIMQMLSAGLRLHFGFLAGVLLLLTNVRELIGQSYERHNNTALLNCLIGGSLLTGWFTWLLGPIMWVPAVLLLGISVPLVVGRASAYETYYKMARSSIGQVRRLIRR